MYTITLIEQDMELCEQVQQIGQHRNQAETLHNALEHYLSHLKRQAIIEEFGQIDFDPAYDHKA